MSSPNEKERLDALIEEIFANLNDLSSLRRQLDQELKDGFLQMAKARSNMGQKSISALQYDDREIMPNVMVDMDSESESFDIVQNRSSASSGDEKTNVRRRLAAKSGDDLEIETVGSVKEDSEREEKQTQDENKPKDPLLMFGVLVPQALRLSKSCFQRSLPMVSKICGVQTTLMRLKTEYGALRAQLGVG